MSTRHTPTVTHLWAVPRGLPARVLTIAAAIILLLSAGGVEAQVPFVQAPPFNAGQVAADDAQRARAGELPLYGRLLPLLVQSSHAGVWSKEGDERVWRLGITSPGALAMEFFLDHARIPEGASMRLMPPSGARGSGAFPILLPDGVSETSTPMTPGDSCIIEYREPVTAPFHGSFRLAQVGHAYRDVGETEDELACYVNTHCLPESEGWEDVIRSTVRISVVVPQGTGWCTGTLVNNVREDCTPYVLSAYHCGRTSTNANLNQYKFYFNFEYPTCAGGNYSTSQFMTGAQMKAYSNDYAPQYQGLGGSDFMLLLLNQEVPHSFNPYWSGWDATNIMTLTGGGVSIHHPLGSPKRVSTFTQNATTGHPMPSSGLMSHYKVTWATTQHGRSVVVNGSSGGGLFREVSGYGPVLVGTLTGSSSGMDCDHPDGTSYFGKMAYHWTENPNTANLKLKAWLDPDDTGTLRIAGTFDPCGNYAGVEEHAGQPGISLYPNPAQDQITVATGSTEPVEYRLMDATGRLVANGILHNASSTIDLSHYNNGGYILHVIDRHTGTQAAPFIITR